MQHATSFSFIWLSIEVKHTTNETGLFPLASGGRCDIKLGYKRDQAQTDHLGASNGVKVKSLLSCCSHSQTSRDSRVGQFQLKITTILSSAEKKERVGHVIIIIISCFNNRKQ